MPGKQRLSGQDINNLLNVIVKEKKVSFQEGGRDLHLRGNRLTGLTVSGKMIQRLKRLKRGELNGIFHTSFLTDNAIEGISNYFVAGRLFMNTTLFDSDNDDMTGVVVAELATYVGNQALVSLHLNNVTESSAGSANINLNVIPQPSG